MLAAPSGTQRCYLLRGSIKQARRLLHPPSIITLSRFYSLTATLDVKDTGPSSSKPSTPTNGINRNGNTDEGLNILPFCSIEVSYTVNALTTRISYIYKVFTL